MLNLGVLSGQNKSAATGVSDDGNTIVGYSGNRSFIWTPDPVTNPRTPDPVTNPPSNTAGGTLQDLTYLQTSLIRSADTVNQLMTSQARNLRDLTQQQCLPGATQRYCLSLGSQAYRGDANSSATQQNLNIAGGLRINEQYSLGASATLGRADLNVQSAKQKSGFGLGLWGAYQQHPDNTGWGANASVATGKSNNDFERGLDLTDVQRARANLDIDGTALRVAGNFGVRVNTPMGETLLTPEVALSHVSTQQKGFTEHNVAFPLTVERSDAHASYATLGVRSATQVTPRGTVHLSLAVDTLLNDQTAGIEGRSNVPGLSQFKLDSSLDRRRATPVAMVGYSHAFDANSTLGGGVQVAGSTYQGGKAVTGVQVQYRYAF